MKYITLTSRKTDIWFSSKSTLVLQVPLIHSNIYYLSTVSDNYISIFKEVFRDLITRNTVIICIDDLIITN